MFDICFECVTVATYTVHAFSGKSSDISQFLLVSLFPCAKSEYWWELDSHLSENENHNFIRTFSITWTIFLWWCVSLVFIRMLWTVLIKGVNMYIDCASSRLI